jgi:hypothetical protein
MLEYTYIEKGEAVLDVEVFQVKNHGQFLIDNPEEVARRIIAIFTCR